MEGLLIYFHIFQIIILYTTYNTFNRLLRLSFGAQGLQRFLQLASIKEFTQLHDILMKNAVIPKKFACYVNF